MRHPRINAAELALIEAGGGLIQMEDAGGAKQVFSWHNVRQPLAHRMLFGIYLGQYCINLLTYFFVT